MVQAGACRRPSEEVAAIEPGEGVARYRRSEGPARRPVPAGFWRSGATARPPAASWSSPGAIGRTPIMLYPRMRVEIAEIVQEVADLRPSEQY